MATYQLADIDVWPEKSVPIDQSARLANGAQQIDNSNIVRFRESKEGKNQKRSNQRYRNTEADKPDTSLPMNDDLLIKCISSRGQS
jgi:hypothetical protein